MRTHALNTAIALMSGYTLGVHMLGGSPSFSFFEGLPFCSGCCMDCRQGLWVGDWTYICNLMLAYLLQRTALQGSDRD